MRIAFSFASAPPLVKKKTSMSPGQICASFWPSLRAHFGRHERVGVGERRRLILDRLDDARIAVADVDAHQLAVEVDEALAFRRPEVDALRLRDRNRIDVRLRRPLVERVLLRQRHHFLSGHCLIEFRRHKFTQTVKT